MKIHIDPVISSRIRQAWAALDDDRKNRIAPLLARANDQALTVCETRKAPPFDPAVPHQALLARSALSNDRDPVVSRLGAGLFIDIGPGGEIWGTGKYEYFDPGWTERIAAWLETFCLGTFPFNSQGPVIRIPNSVQIALAGDWGTGDWRTERNPAPATDVARRITFLQPQITIHLGDVYYAGSKDQELHLLTNLWPKGSAHTFALNSNHEMYSGARPYFEEALGSPVFGDQQRSSFFALENDNWVVVGLEPAFYADPDTLYIHGSLCSTKEPPYQLNFLRNQVAKGKKITVLTHHNGLSEDGCRTTNLWSQVMSVFPEGTGPAYWYWGHVHAGVVYKPNGPDVRCRCCGPGAIPWAEAALLKSSANVEWYEKRCAHDPDIPQRVLNGFAILTLKDTNLKEVFYDENGGIAWQS